MHPKIIVFVMSDIISRYRHFSNTFFTVQYGQLNSQGITISEIPFSNNETTTD